MSFRFRSISRSAQHAARSANALVAALLSTALAGAAVAQTGPMPDIDLDDPLEVGAGQLLLPSEEVLLLHNVGADVYQTTWNGPGPIETNDLNAPASVVRTSSLSGALDGDIVSGDFDGDGLPDVYSVWEAPGGKIGISLPQLDRGALLTTSDSFTSPNGGFSSVSAPFQQDALLQYAVSVRDLRLAAGDVDGDGDDEFILAWRSANQLRVNVYGLDDTQTPLFPGTVGVETIAMQTVGLLDGCSSGAGYYPAGAAQLSVTTGDYNGDGTDEVAVFSIANDCETIGGNSVDAWTQRAYVEVLDYDAGSSGVVARGNNYSIQQYIDGHRRTRSTGVWTQNSGFYRVHADSGDLDGDARDELVVAWTGPSGIGAARVARLSGGSDGLDTVTLGSLEVLNPTTTAYDGQPFQVLVDDLDNSGSAEVITRAKQTLRIYNVDDLLDWTLAGEHLLDVSSEADISHRAVAVADVDLDTSDVFAKEILALDQIDIATGGMARLVNLRFDAQAATPQTALSTIRTQILPGADAHKLAMVPINIDGDGANLVLGACEDRNNVLQPLVLLNSPPIHFDAFDRSPLEGSCFTNLGGGGYQIDPECYDVNLCYPAASTVCESNATYTQSMQVDIQTETQATWAKSTTRTVSGSLSVPVGSFVTAQIDAQLSETIGTNFSNRNYAERSVFQASTRVADRDDRVFGSVSSYRVCEYDVITNLPYPIGHVASVIPRFSTSLWFGTTGSFQLQTFPDHEVANVLSYKNLVTTPSDDLSDVDAAAESVYIQLDVSQIPSVQSSTPESSLIEFTDFTQTAATRETNQEISSRVSASVSGGFKGVGASIGASVAGTYATSDVNTHTTSVETTGSVNILYGRYDPTLQVGGVPVGSAEYLVRPYVYWSQEGTLVVDYSVELTGGLWTALYGDAPDLTMILPWRHDQAKGFLSTPFDQTERTRDLVLNPRNPEPGEMVEAILRVQNYSLVDLALTTTASVYLGDPRQGGTLLAQAQVPPIDARDRALVTFPEFVAPPAGGVCPTYPGAPLSCLYVELDSTDAIGEIHEDNNIGWVGYTVPEPGMGLSLMIGAVALAGVGRRGRSESRTSTRPSSWRSRCSATSATPERGSSTSP
jgi:hypothetical protein